MLRAVDGFGRVTTKVYDSELQFKADLERYQSEGYTVEGWHKREVWELWT